MPKAKHFYEDILGLKPVSVFGDGVDMAFIEYEIGPHTLAIGKGATDFVPGKVGAVAALEVEDFDEAIKVLKENNIPFINEPADYPSCNIVTGDIASHYSPIAGYSTPIPNTGSYSWTIPDSLGNGYMKLNGGNVYGLTIANYGDGDVYDSSNNLFSIATSTDEVINVDLTSTCPATHFDTDRAIGSAGNDVVALQNFLMAKGYGASTTGYFGSNTRSSLMAYQVSRGITPVDGYFENLLGLQ